MIFERVRDLTGLRFSQQTKKKFYGQTRFERERKKREKERKKRENKKE